MHLIALHDSAGSGNPLGVSGNYDRLPFAPYYIFKDLITIFIFILILSLFVFFMPNLLGDSENYVMANPMQTPPAIVPEWYLLPFYAILRSIPNKLLGVIAMFSAILILLVMPFTDLSRSRGIQFKPLSKAAFFVFVGNFLILMELGAKHVESPFIEFGQICTVLYFAHFLIIVPLISLLENTLIELSNSSSHNYPYKLLPGYYNNIVVESRPFPWNIAPNNLYAYSTSYRGILPSTRRGGSIISYLRGGGTITTDITNGRSEIINAAAQIVDLTYNQITQDDNVQQVFNRIARSRGDVDGGEYWPDPLNSPDNSSQIAHNNNKNRNNYNNKRGGGGGAGAGAVSSSVSVGPSNNNKKIVFMFVIIVLFVSFAVLFLTGMPNVVTIFDYQCLHCDAPRPWGIYFQDSATPQMEALVELHDNILFYLVIILFGVGWLLTSIVKNYTNTESPISHKYLSHGTLIELIWTITPALILILIAFPSFKLLYLMDEVSDPSMAILAEGHQWYWSYQYPDFLNSDDEFIEFDSYLVPESDLDNGALRMLEVDNRLILPELTHVRFIVTGADVIHSLACPAIGIKCDAYPGRLNQTSVMINREGVFYGQCSEICGILHSSMPIVIESVSIEKFVSWLQEQ